ncbi:MAG: enoyl-CoA hydratase/isomerase family protein [Acidimicrobiia bacterium]
MSDESVPLVRVGKDGPVMVITLDRPERHNSLIPELLIQLLGALNETGENPAIRAVVLQAAGRSFSTGGDVRGFWEERDRIASFANEIVGLLNETMLTMMRLPQPIIGAVHGPVTGGSLGLVLACDIVLVSPEASFTPWYGPVGFAPDGGWTAILPAAIGQDRVNDILASNRSISADEAVAWGIASDMARAESIGEEALLEAHRIAGRTTETAHHLKARRPQEVAATFQRLEEERRAFVLQVTTDEAAAGMARYLGVDSDR